MVSKRHLRGTEPLGYVEPLTLPNCPLCGRAMVPGASVDEHHLLPKSCGGKTKDPETESEVLQCNTQNVCCRISSSWYDFDSCLRPDLLGWRPKKPL